MSSFKRALPAPGASTSTSTSVSASSGARSNPLSSLKHTTMIVPEKAVLPAEIIASILDHLAIPDLLCFGRASKRMLEMVYEDSRWVRRLRAMGVWDEVAARKRWSASLDDTKTTTMAVGRGDATWDMGRPRSGGDGNGQGTASSTLFDASLEEQEEVSRLKLGMNSAMETLTISTGYSLPARAPRAPMQDPEKVLDVLQDVRSIRGAARQEFGKIYGALAPFYLDLARAGACREALMFRIFQTPEQQAKMLAQLQAFARSDWAQGCAERQDKLTDTVRMFGAAVLNEFERALESRDVQGDMRRYAHVLATLNQGQASVDLFLERNPILTEKETLGRSMDCLNQAASDAIALDPSREFFERLLRKVNEQVVLIDGVFPPGIDVLQQLLDRIAKDVLMEYVTPLFHEAHERSIPSYLKAVAGIFQQCTQFATTIKPSKTSQGDFSESTQALVARVFQPHIDLYLREELENFKQHAEGKVEEWVSQLSEQEASTESFFMSNFNRQADKSDFMSSFKKVVMMPVKVLPFGASKSSSVSALRTPIRSASPVRPQSMGFNHITVPKEAPTTELAAKAALMASKLEGIRSLFSIEIALELTHAAKSSIERAMHFVWLGGQTKEQAREQCQAIFVTLLQVLGDRHVKIGFEKAVGHLSRYNPREVSEHHHEVAPLVTFLELVNVGDLIGQMIDVFYEQQLVSTSLTDRNDFMDSAGKEKKKFEQMLDAAVAAGLGKGIDVLMDEVEYVCGSIQAPTDYNPPPAPSVSAKSPITPGFEVGPTPAATRIVDLVSTHTAMLRGSTDKTTLDIFNQEVGLRLFTTLCKHLKRQRISTDGAMRLISDMNGYWDFIRTLRNVELEAYFRALRELSQIYLVDAKQHAKELAIIIADGARFGGIFRAEEVFEFAQRRADWFAVRKDVERAMYGLECVVI